MGSDDDVGSCQVGAGFFVTSFEGGITGSLQGGVINLTNPIFA